MNSLTDEVLVYALISAAQAGVEIDLIVRGACILPVGALGVGGRIRVRSIVGRFLEHSRIFYFEIEDAKGTATQRMWLSSADWMNRNMIRRIEIAWPIQDKTMQQNILQSCLVPYVDDAEDAWILTAGGEYQPLSAHGVHKKSAQKTLIQHYSTD